MNSHPSDVPHDLPADSLETYDPVRSAATNSGVERTAALSDAEAVAPLPIPELQSRSFELVSRVGRGGMGEVWEARQGSLRRTIAIKTIRRDLLADQPDEPSRGRIRREFVQEAVTTANLEHPHIVPVYDLGEGDESGSPLLAMKLVNGRAWNVALREDWSSMHVEDFLARHIPILICVSQAVAFAHSRGIVHRDLKPAQVMLGDFGEVLLMDWGLSIVHDSTAAAQKHPEFAEGLLTPTRDQASNPSGTPAFMAPEQTDSTAARIGPATDVFLLGATLYLVLTGETPHGIGTSAEVFSRARTCSIIPPAERVPTRLIPEELGALAMAAMRPEPLDRVASALKFVEGLQSYLSGAGRRRESTVQTDRAATVLRAAASYAEFASCSASLDQAAALWPGNPALGALRQDVLAGHVKLAIKNGDLVLAQVQAERIEAAPVREPLVREVLAAQRAAARGAHQRRVLLASTVALLIAVLGAGLIIQRQQARVQEEATARLIAQQQAEAEKLRAESSERIAKLLERINLLRVDETKLSDDIRSEGYNPASRLWRRGDTAGVNAVLHELRDEDAIFERLGRRRSELKTRRDGLRPEAGDAIGPEPTAFLLFDANKKWYEVTDIAQSKDLYFDYEKIAARDERDPEPLIMMAMLGAISKETTSATMAITRALDRSAARDGRSSSEYARIQLAQSAIVGMQMRELKGSAKAWGDARRLLADDWIRLGTILAEMHRQVGSDEAALGFAEEMQRVMELVFPEDEKRLGPVLSARGLSLMSLGRLDEAEPLLNRALEIHIKFSGPDHMNVISSRVNLARLYLRMGRPADAIEPIESAREGLKKQAKRNAQLEFDLPRMEGEARTALGEFDAAKAVLEPLVEHARTELGPDQGITFQCEAAWLEYLVASGRADDAASEGAEILARAKTVLGEESSITKRIERAISPAAK